MTACVATMPCAAAAQVHAFDLNALVTAVTSLIVLMGAAKVVLDFVVFYLLPRGHSLVLRNKRDEYAPATQMPETPPDSSPDAIGESLRSCHQLYLTARVASRNGLLGEMGMRAAMAVHQFEALDRERQGTLGLDDLAGIFARVPSIGPDQAYLIAKCIVNVSDRSQAHADAFHLTDWRMVFQRVLRQFHLPDGSGSVGEGGSTTARRRGDGISFNEFVSLVAGDATTFDDFTSLVEHAAHGTSKGEAAKARAAFQARRSGNPTADGSALSPEEDDAVRQPGGGSKVANNQVV